MGVLEYILPMLGGTGIILGAIGQMWRRNNARLRELEAERDRETDNVRQERDDLRKRVSDLEVKLQSQATEINSLRTQLNTVCRQLEDNQARLEKAEQWGETKEAEATRWKADAEQLRMETAKQATRIQELEIEARTYKSSLALVGQKLAEKAEVSESGDETSNDNTKDKKEQS